MASTQRIVISGMTCGHCERAVAAELTAIAGVDHVEVSAERGEAVVSAATAVPEADLRAAVDEAGYQVDRVE